MSVDYNHFAKTFATSRKNMKWEEVEYFFSFLQGNESICDIACGSGRLLEQYIDYFGKNPSMYIGIDLSNELLTEAQICFSDANFQVGKMQEASKYIPKDIFEHIFCIAGFHHLETQEERIQTLKDWSSILPLGGKIFMTNWALESSVNLEKYKTYRVTGETGIFQSSDFMIPIGKHDRYYHGFDLGELEYIALQAGLHICENRLFETQKNFISILQK